MVVILQYMNMFIIKKDVKNKDLWTKLDSIISKKEITWNWVKAHSINKYNNKVDIIARNAANAND